MDTKSQQRQDFTLSSLNVAIEAMNLATEIASIPPAKAVFGSAGVVLAMIKVCFFPVSLGGPDISKRGKGVISRFSVLIVRISASNPVL